MYRRKILQKKKKKKKIYMVPTVCESCAILITFSYAFIDLGERKGEGEKEKRQR